MDFVRAMASGSKGGQRGQFIDPTAVIPAIRRVQRRWELSGPPPDAVQNQQDAFGRLARLDNKIRMELSTVASVEWHQSTDWTRDWHNNIGEDITGEEAIAEVRELMTIAMNSGIAFNSSVRQGMEMVLAELAGSQLNDSLRWAARLLENSEPLKLLPALGKGRSNQAEKR